MCRNMKTFAKQYIAPFGESVITINAGESTTFHLNCTGLKKNKSVIVTANISLQYLTGDFVHMDIQRDGQSIIGGSRVMFGKNDISGYTYPISNLTYTLSTVDDSLVSKNNQYQFIISSVKYQVVVLQAIFSAKIIDSDLINTNQLYPPMGQTVSSISSLQSTKIIIPVPVSKNKHVARLINASINFTCGAGSLVQAEILNPSGVSLTGGLQNILSLGGSSPGVINYEANINYNVVDDMLYQKSSVPEYYTLHIMNNSVIEQANEIKIYFYSFYAYIIPNDNIRSVNNFIESGVPVATIPTNGKITQTYQSESHNSLKNLQFLASFNTGFLQGTYPVTVNILKRNKSITNGLFPLFSLGAQSTMNSQITFFDENKNNDPYTIEIYNQGPLPVNIDFYNMILTGEDGSINENNKNMIIPVTVPLVNSNQKLVLTNNGNSTWSGQIPLTGGIISYQTFSIALKLIPTFNPMNSNNAVPNQIVGTIAFYWTYDTITSDLYFAANGFTDLSYQSINGVPTILMNSDPFVGGKGSSPITFYIYINPSNNVASLSGTYSINYGSSSPFI
jgi:hypothetical protein